MLNTVSDPPVARKSLLAGFTGVATALSVAADEGVAVATTSVAAARATAATAVRVIRIDRVKVDRLSVLTLLSSRTLGTAGRTLVACRTAAWALLADYLRFIS